MSKMGEYVMGIQEVVDANFDSDFSVVEGIVRNTYPELGELAVNFARDEHSVILREWREYADYCNGTDDD